MIKQKLLALGIVKDNEFLNKYCELIEDNFSTQKEKFKTQAHHIIPRFIFKTNWIVNLSNYNHALAHYYLCFCLIDEYKLKNEHAFFRMINCNFKQDISYCFDEYSKVFEDFCIRKSEFQKGKLHTKEEKEKISKSNLKYYAEHPEMKLEKSKSFKGKHHSEETKEKLRKIHLGKYLGKDNPNYGNRWNDEQRKRASEYWKKKYKDHPELVEAISKRKKGNWAGSKNPMYGLKGDKNPIHHTKWMNKNGKSLRVNEEKIQEYLNNGWNMGRR